MNKETEFAAAERKDRKTIFDEFKNISNNKLSLQFINSVPNLVAILNENRQLVFSNNSLLNYTKLTIEDLLGKRPGEILNCMHSDEKSGGCGTTKFCSECGAVNAILESQKSGSAIKECRIIQKDNNALDLLVWSNKIEIDGKEFIIFSLSDKSNENRRKILESIFFHDIMNTAGGIKGFIELMEDSKPEELAEMQSLLKGLSLRLIDEIDAQRQLRSAEENDLIPNYQFANAVEIIKSVQSSFLSKVVHQNLIKINIPENSEFIKIQTDLVLIKRILVNLVKNAIEAVNSSETVEIGIKNISEETIKFYVSNPGVIPGKIQLQLFQRSFSTKGPDRGLGTYSVKLLAENFLKGKISFVSNAETGTIFYVDLPRYEP